MNSYCSSLTLVLDDHLPPYIKLLIVISFFSADAPRSEHGNLPSGERGSREDKAGRLRRASERRAIHRKPNPGPKQTDQQGEKRY